MIATNTFAMVHLLGLTIDEIAAAEALVRRAGGGAVPTGEVMTPLGSDRHPTPAEPRCLRSRPTK